jgi:hypothetical protein
LVIWGKADVDHRASREIGKELVGFCVVTDQFYAGLVTHNEDLLPVNAGLGRVKAQGTGGQLNGADADLAERVCFLANRPNIFLTISHRFKNKIPTIRSPTASIDSLDFTPIREQAMQICPVGGGLPNLNARCGTYCEAQNPFIRGPAKPKRKITVEIGDLASSATILWEHE